jgi:DNA-binding response OmpR family regulator
MRSVLLIEDEAPLSRLIVWGLVEPGFMVAAVAHCADALLGLGSFHPDVIVFNRVIEHSDKNACIEAIRLSAPRSRIIDVSMEKNTHARGMVEVPRNGVRADEHLALPFPIERLVDMIRELLV